MSEPRTKIVSQANVRDFMREGCEAVHAHDPRALCVVGPRPFYKLWELNADVLQPVGSNALYTVLSHAHARTRAQRTRTHSLSTRAQPLALAACMPP